MTTKEPAAVPPSGEVEVQRSELLRLKCEDADLDQRIQYDRSSTSPLFTLAGFSLALMVLVINLGGEDFSVNPAIQFCILLAVFLTCTATGVHRLSRGKSNAQQLVLTRQAILKLEHELRED